MEKSIKNFIKNLLPFTGSLTEKGVYREMLNYQGTFAEYVSDLKSALEENPESLEGKCSLMAARDFANAVSLNIDKVLDRRQRLISSDQPLLDRVRQVTSSELDCYLRDFNSELRGLFNMEGLLIFPLSEIVVNPARVVLGYDAHADSDIYPYVRKYLLESGIVKKSQISGSSVFRKGRRDEYVGTTLKFGKNMQIQIKSVANPFENVEF